MPREPGRWRLPPLRRLARSTTSAPFASFICSCGLRGWRVECVDFVLPFMRRWQPTPHPQHRDSTDSGWGAVPSHRGIAGLQQSPLSYVTMPIASAVCPSVEGIASVPNEEYYFSHPVLVVKPCCTRVALGISFCAV